MATIRKRGNRYHVQVRRRGQTVTRTFDRLATAKSWIPKIEGDIERYLIRRYSVFLGLPFLEKYISPSIDKSLADAVGEF